MNGPVSQANRILLPRDNISGALFVVKSSLQIPRKIFLGKKLETNLTNPFYCVSIETESGWKLFHLCALERLILISIPPITDLDLHLAHQLCLVLTFCLVTILLVDSEQVVATKTFSNKLDECVDSGKMETWSCLHHSPLKDQKNHNLNPKGNREFGLVLRNCAEKIATSWSRLLPLNVKFYKYSHVNFFRVTSILNAVCFPPDQRSLNVFWFAFPSTPRK